jgi:isopentenyl diphosphate isomerase/L-lactate dehydrogenase-like FMN-dependent dehydrogenase
MIVQLVATQLRIGKANGHGPLFIQLYLPHDDERAVSLLHHAWDGGFDVCVMTVDTWQLVWRRSDVQTANYAYRMYIIYQS